MKTTPRYKVEGPNNGPFGPMYDVVDTQAEKIWNRTKSSMGGPNAKARATAEAAKLNNAAIHSATA